MANVTLNQSENAVTENAAWQKKLRESKQVSEVVEDAGEKKSES